MTHRHPNIPSAAVLSVFAAVSFYACGGGRDDGAAPPPAVVAADGCAINAAPAPGDSAFCRGKANFHDRALAGLGGNGRACSDCHIDSENFQLTPSAAQSRFEQMTLTGI